MKKCPCEECIARPMCSRRESIIKLMMECRMLAEYISNKEHILITAKIIRPYWFSVHNDHNLPEILDNILSNSLAIRKYSDEKLPV